MARLARTRRRKARVGLVTSRVHYAFLVRLAMHPPGARSLIGPPIGATSAFVDVYALLGVAPDASASELKAAHRALVRRHHPDVVPPPERAAATRRVQEINVAYGLVRDPNARGRYDRMRSVHERPRASNTDIVAAAEWERAVAAAGRWAGGWWAANRTRVATVVEPATRRARSTGMGTLRAVAGARTVALDAVGRVLWLATCAAGGLVGLVAALAAEGLTEVASPLVVLTGTLAGIWVGHRRGWRRRLLLAGRQPGLRRWTTPLELAVWAAVVGVALWLTVALR